MNLVEKEMMTPASCEHEQVVYCHDKETQLRAIIAIHDTSLGPALGGCRFWNYDSEQAALFDVLRLSKGMTYKAAVAGLSLGGGKSVIIGDPKKLKSKDFFRSFGAFVQSLAGRYITAEDVNINVEDITHAALETKYVSGTEGPGGSGDPSPVTALGVFYGIKASVKYKLNRDDLSGLTIAVQGCGSVGSHLCKYLHAEGVKLIVSDIDPSKAQTIADSYGAQVVALDQVHQKEVDVFAPCALGAILNQDTIGQLQTSIVAGGANNQLLNELEDSQRLIDRGILYAPDYVINAGGLINVYHELKGYDQQAAFSDAKKIYDTLIEIYQKSEKNGQSTILASNELAQARLKRPNGAGRLRNSYDNQDWIKI